MRRSDAQWQLLTLVAGEGATIKSLASRLEVSDKTIRRDLNTLRRVGVPRASEQLHRRLSRPRRDPRKNKIRVDSSAARYVQEKRKHASQQVTLQPDGSALVEFHIANTPELKSWILSFGPSAEVLEPGSLRD